MEEFDKIKSQITPKKKKKFSTFLFFLFLSTTFWVLIKLSKPYSTQTTFIIHYSDIPVEKWISTPEESAQLTFTTNGFRTLRHNLIRKQKRIVTIPLSEIVYRNMGGNTYSYSSQYVAEKIASRLNITPNDILLNESTFFFEMDNLDSKVVPIRLKKDIDLERQYDFYGDPVIAPTAVTIYGPANLLDTINYINTDLLRKENVNKTLSEELELNLMNGSIRANVSKVHVTIAIEKFTETVISVPIQKINNVQLRYFPENINVQCLVAIKDYSEVNADAFTAEVNKSQLSNLEPLLDVRLTHAPSNIHIMKVEPEQVEYILIQQ